MQMIKQGVIHLREPSLVGKHYRIVKEYCFVGVVTPPYLIEHANLHSKTQKAIRIKLCLVVLICISQHESPCMGKTKTKLSLRHFLQTKSISLNCYWDGLIFIIHIMFRGWRVVGDAVGRCVTGHRLPLNDTVHTLRTPITGFWLKVYLRRDQNWMHEIDLFFPGQVLLHLLDTGLTLVFYVECVRADGRLEAEQLSLKCSWGHCLRCFREELQRSSVAFH